MTAMVRKLIYRDEDLSFPPGAKSRRWVRVCINEGAGISPEDDVEMLPNKADAKVQATSWAEFVRFCRVDQDLIVKAEEAMKLAVPEIIFLDAKDLKSQVLTRLSQILASKKN